MSKVREFLESAVENRTFPGASYAFGTATTVESGAVGKFGYEGDWPIVTVDTPYDLASLTKVIATTSVARKLCQDSIVLLETTVADVIPDFRDKRVTVDNLLRHESGLPSYIDLTTEILSSDEVRSRLIQFSGDRPQYSCVGFIVLQLVLEKCTGRSLDQLFRETVSEPMHWEATAFRSANELDKAFPPTSTIEPWRKPLLKPLDSDWLQGVVHDPLAFLMGGVSGNAGLFGTIKEIAGFCQTILQDDPQCVWWTKRPGHERGLGWDFKSPTGSSAGTSFSDSTFGHTGFTGTSMWIDPVAGIFALLFSNAIYQSGGPSFLLPVRSQYCNLVHCALM